MRIYVTIRDHINRTIFLLVITLCILIATAAVRCDLLGHALHTCHVTNTYVRHEMHVHPVYCIVQV